MMKILLIAAAFDYLIVKIEDFSYYKSCACGNNMKTVKILTGIFW